VEKLLIIISSPSGGGKTTLCKRLLSDPTSPLYNKAEFSISATTRAMRPTEVEGKDYFFISGSEFERMIKENEFLEYARIFNNFYGTPLFGISKTKHTIFDIDFQGHHQLKKKKKAVSIFLLPPSIEVLKERIKKRGDLLPKEIALRIEKAPIEMKEGEKYDYIIINDNLETAFREACTIIETEIKKLS
jgi:guanylate kinase